jgi:hypothetical protein
MAQSYFKDFDASKSVWEVNDHLLIKPEIRFQPEGCPLIEATVYNWSVAIFEDARIPDDLTQFVVGLCKMFHIPKPTLCDVEDPLISMLQHIGYQDPYLPLVDTMVQLTNHSMLYTYKVKSTGDTLDPSKVEVFAVNTDWKFEPYYAAQSIIEAPAFQAFLRGEYIPEAAMIAANGDVTRARHETILMALEKLINSVYGPMQNFNWVVSENMFAFHDNNSFEERHARTSGMTQADIDAAQTADELFWMVASAATVIWLKSPRALPFLIEKHPVYACLLYEDPDTGKIMLEPNTGGKVLVDHEQVYTLYEIAEFKTAPPGSCESCGGAHHCSKYINIVALKNPICSCGDEVDPRDTGLSSHNPQNYRCKPYATKYPPTSGFVCQRCMHVTLNNLDRQTTPCGRVTCPATDCRFHMGDRARLHALTAARTRVLTGQSPG